jgi:hypothetical protein
LESITSSLYVVYGRAAPLNKIFSSIALLHRTTVKLNAIMKTWFTSKAIFKGGSSETNQTSNELQNATSESLRAGKPALMGLSWSAQCSGSPMRRRDESSFMQSQLG